MSAPNARIVLASGSAARAAMLRNAGVSFEVIPADVDEDAIRAGLPVEARRNGPIDVALALAEAKAAAVSQQHQDAIVIGADQVLALGDEIVSKARTVEEARATLVRLRGRQHELLCGVSIHRKGAMVRGIVDEARLVVRKFSDAWLDHYVASAGPALTTCVGAYQLEGLGMQLFEDIRGDYFTILGMPLLPVLAVLREIRVLPA